MVTWTLEPYYAPGATESKSVVLRSQPPDFFRPYSSYLTEARGRFNPHLSDPSGGKLPGWIFSNKEEAQVRQLIERLVQLPPMAIPGPPTLIPISADPRIQVISIIRPIPGERLTLLTGDQSYPMEVLSVEETPDGYVKGAIVKIGDQTSQIQVNNDFKWQVPHFHSPHNIQQ